MPKNGSLGCVLGDFGTPTQPAFEDREQVLRGFFFFFGLIFMTVPSRYRTYLNVRFLRCILLGFSSGLPLFVLVNLVQAWLSSEGVDIETIGLFALIQFPYTWKFLWAPLMDRFSLRFMGWMPGRRRGWALLTQVMVMIGIALLGQVSPRHAMWAVVAVALGLALSSASQDIVLDAWRREQLDEREQGLGAAMYVNAYKMASLVPGSLSFILADHLPWSMVFGVTAVFMLPGLLCTLLSTEPAVQGSPPRSLLDAVVLPFREFIARDGWGGALWILAFIFLYRLGDSMATSLATPFFLDIGFSKTQIGTVAKVGGLWASVLGGLVGGVLLLRIGITRGLWIFGLAQWSAIFGFIWLATQGPTILGLAIVMCFETFSVGLGLSAFTAYLATVTDPRYTATQFALFTSLAAVPRTVINGLTGYIVAYTGWFNFFCICAALALPGMLLLRKIAPWHAADKPSSRSVR